MPRRPKVPKIAISPGVRRPGAPGNGRLAPPKPPGRPVAAPRRFATKAKPSYLKP